MKGFIQTGENGPLTQTFSGVVQSVESLIGGIDHSETFAVQNSRVYRAAVAVFVAVTVAGSSAGASVSHFTRALAAGVDDRGGSAGAGGSGSGAGTAFPLFFQTVFAAQGQEERASPQVPQEARVFQGRLQELQASRVPQGVLP